MNKLIMISIFLVVGILIQIPAVSAWNWNTHQEMVESNYNALPQDIKQNLDLDAMKEGSIDPDFKFMDFKYHSYPNSYTKAEEWLNRGHYYYKKGDYHYASYCYGVASHYITDSFSAPHCANIKGTEHALYETKASLLTPKQSITNGDLKTTLNSGQFSGKNDWNAWINSDNDSYIQNNMNEATGASYNAIDESIINSYPIQKDDSKNTDYLMTLVSLL